MSTIYTLCSNVATLLLMIPVVYTGVIRVGTGVSINSNDLNSISSGPRIIQAKDLPLPETDKPSPARSTSIPTNTRKISIHNRPRDRQQSIETLSPEITRGKVNLNPKRPAGPTRRPRPQVSRKTRPSPQPRAKKPRKQPVFDGPLPDGGILNIPKTGPLFPHILPGIDHDRGIDVLGIKGGKLAAFRNGVFRQLTGVSNVPLGPLGVGEFGPRKGGGILGCGGVFGGGKGVNFSPFGSFGEQFTLDLRAFQIPALQRLC